MGSGFKDFAAGDVLTAADVDGYLMRQTVMTFADASARDTALSGVLDEGMVAYLEDVNALTVYNGSAWVAVIDSDVLTVDTANDRVGINDATPSYALDVTGDINASSDFKLAGDSMPRGVVGSVVRTSTASITTSPQTTHTVTFTAVSGRKYVAMLSAPVEANNTAGAVYAFDIKQGATRLAAGRLECSTTTEAHELNLMVELPSTSGSTTLTVEIFVSAGTGFLGATATNRSTFVVLDVGT